MNALFAVPLGIAAALGGTADAATLTEEPPAPAPIALPAVEPVRDLLAPELLEAAARLDATDPAKVCDDKCQVVALTETALPGTGVSDVLSVLFAPEEHAVNIPKSDGTPALTITVLPTKITRGEGLVATAKF